MIIDSNQLDRERPRIWHKQHEKVLRGWGESAACYRYMHYKAHTLYKRMSMRMTLPIIIISTVTGTANFAQETFPISMRAYVPAMIGTMNLFAAILTTLLQFLKVNELVEAHRVSSVHYGKLARNIRLELALPITERAHDGGNLVEVSKDEYDRLIEQSPPVPGKVVRLFERQFPEVPGANKAQVRKFMRPEIMTIRPIQLYDNDYEKQMTDSVVNAFKDRVISSNSNVVSVDVWSNDPHHSALVNELKEIQEESEPVELDTVVVMEEGTVDKDENA